MQNPSLLLKPAAYKTSKLYSQLPVNGDGDAVVLSYNGSGGRVNKHMLLEDVPNLTPKIDYRDGYGLLLEPNRTNLATYSNQINQWSTLGGATVSTNEEISPAGKLDADVVRDETNGSAYISLDWPVSDATAIHAASFFAKEVDSHKFDVRVYSNGSVLYTADYRIDLREETATLIADSQSQHVNAFVEDWGCGWKRVVFIFDMVNANTNIGFQVYPSIFFSAGAQEDSSSIAMWGVQVEEGDFETYPIETNTTSVNRTMDSLTISDPVTNGLMELSRFSIMLDMQIKEEDSDFPSNAIFYIGGTSAIRIRPESSFTNHRNKIIVSGTDATESTYELPAGRKKVLFNAYDGGVDVWVDGEKVLTYSGRFYLSAQTIYLRGVGARWKLRKLAIFKTPLSDSESKSITQ